MLSGTRLLLRSIVGVVITLALLVGLLVLRVSREPLSVGFLAPYIEQSFVQARLGLDMTFGDVVLAWDDTDQTIRLRVLDAAFTPSRQEAQGAAPGAAAPGSPAAGDLFLRVPVLDLSLSGPSLLRGVVAPTYIRAAGIVARLTRDEQGHFLLDLPALDTGDAAQPADQSTAPAVHASAATDSNFVGQVFGLMFDRLSRPPDPTDPLSRIGTVAIDVARLTLDDRKLNRRWVAPGASLRLTRGDGRVRAQFEGALDYRGKQLGFAVESEYVAADRAAYAAASFQGVEPADFADLTPDTAVLAGWNLPLSGILNFRIDQQGELTDLRYDLRVGAGQVVLAEILRDPQSAGPVAVSSAQITGRYLGGATETVWIDNFTAQFADGAKLSATGEVVRAQQNQVSLDLKGGFSGVSTDALRRTWPRSLAAGARDWVRTHIRGGGVQEARFAVKLSPEMLAGTQKLPREAVSLDFLFDGLSVDYFPPLTKLTDAKGRAKLDADEFNLTVENGKVGNLQTSGPVKITGLQARDQFADITVTTKGSSAESLSLIDMKPLGYPSKLGIQPASVGGQSSITARFRFPLDNKLKLDDVVFQADATLVDLSLPNISDRFHLTRGNVKMRVDAKGLDAGGDVALNGVPVALSWRQEFDGKLPVQARYKIKGTADGEGRKALGFDLAPYIDGPAPADIDIESLATRDTMIRAKLDLAPATLTFDELYWKKPAGKAGEASFTARLRDGQATEFQAIHLTSGDMTASGSATLNRDNSWVLKLAELALGGNRASAELRRAANGDMDLKAEGKRFDLTEYLKDRPEDDDPKPGPRFNASIRLDEAVLDEHTAVSHFALEMKRGPVLVERLTLDAQFKSGGKLNLNILPDGKGRALRLQSDDAGSMFAYLGVENMQGGSFRIDGRYDDEKPGSPLSGRLTAEKFKAVRAPFLARLFGIGSFTGLAALLSGEGISFDNADVPFQQNRGVLTIQPSRFQGPQLGITFEGQVNKRTNQIAITGTAVPAFVLNTILGKIPLLGDIFVGEGIIGVNFAMNGPRDKAEMVVNPLSAVAPGFLRRIFQAGSSTTPLAPGQAAPNNQAGPNQKIPEAEAKPVEKPQPTP